MFPISYSLNITTTELSRARRDENSKNKGHMSEYLDLNFSPSRKEISWEILMILNQLFSRKLYNLNCKDRVMAE